MRQPVAADARVLRFHAAYYVSGAGSIAYGTGLATGTAGTTSYFTIAARDKFGNDRYGILYGTGIEKGASTYPVSFSDCGSLCYRTVSMADGASDTFRVLAVLRNTSGVSTGGTGVPEVAGVVNFNPSTLLHDVQWKPTVCAFR